MLTEVLQWPTLHAVQSCCLPIGLAAQCLDDLRHSDPHIRLRSPCW